MSVIIPALPNNAGDLPAVLHQMADMIRQLEIADAYMLDYTPNAPGSLSVIRGLRIELLVDWPSGDFAYTSLHGWLSAAAWEANEAWAEAAKLALSVPPFE